MGKRAIWAIHAGRDGEADSLFREQKCVALGWSQVGDLSALKERAEFKEVFAKAGEKSSKIPYAAGQLYLFAREMKIGDVVVVPFREERLVRFGEVTSEYAFTLDSFLRFPHRRAVKWLRDVPREKIAESALGEIDVPLAISRVRRNVSNFALHVTPDLAASEFEVDAPKHAEADAVTRIGRKLTRSIPSESDLRAAIDLLAYAIENADEERSDAWTLRETGQGLALFAGRVLACRIGRGRIDLSVMGPVSDETRTTLSAEPSDNEAWRAVPGALLVTFPPDKATLALELLKDALDKFVDEAMAHVRRRVSLETHERGAVLYLSGIVGRDLPNPSASDESDDGHEDEGDEADAYQSREPKIRGRRSIFEDTRRSIASLLEDVHDERIALPDLQRPFVWEDTKVRDLLDSIFVGFPVGTLVFWETSSAKDAHTVGAQQKPALRATSLIIDGQQRITSLYAVMRGVEVTDKDGAKRRIEIAFRPRDGRFEVADAAIRRDPEFIPNVRVLWDNVKTTTALRKELLRAVRESKHAEEVTDAYEEAVEQNLDRARAIADYSFPAIEIRKTSAHEDVKEEDVAEIFVRINNQGARLGQADFVLTLLSVFHGELRDLIEKQSTEMSKESVVGIDTQQLLRAACAVGFGRARMSAIYRFLRGVDPSSGDTNVESRKSRLENLDAAAKECIASTTWRDYMLRVVRAGFVSPALIGSTNAIINGYAFYVLGQRLKIDKAVRDDVLSRWLFGSLLSARYSSSSETRFEQDLTRLHALQHQDADGFMRAIDEMLSETLSGDYWAFALVRELETQRSRAPAALAFRAAQVVLGARALFSDQPLQNLLAPPGKGARAASESHHLFPTAWLSSHGVKERKRINQVANLADLGWHENNIIGASRPADYVPRLRDKLKLDDDQWGRACAEHALPIGWETMDYDTFLRERRQRMADLIRVAYRKLGGEADSAPVTPPWFLPGSAMVWIQIVNTERALRALVREAYARQFGANAPDKITEALSERERESLTRARRGAPASADPMSIVDFLYFAQLPPLLFNAPIWQNVREKFGGTSDAKHRLQTATELVVRVRNEIAHAREVEPTRLQSANVACTDILTMVAK